MGNYENLTDLQKMAFNLYKGNSPFDGQQCFADYLNQTLRRRESLNPEWEEKATTLDQIVNLNVSKDCVILYRATFDDFVLPFISEDKYEYPAYMSTTEDETV